jgi:hypothetical protein
VGEAKRRRAAFAAWSVDIKDDVAAIVQAQNSFLFFDVKGRSFAQEKGRQCLWRAVTGHVALEVLGLPTRLVSGRVLYRPGPDDGHDIALHFWLMAGDQLIDFSPADWRDAVDDSAPAWHVMPARYHWDNRALFTMQLAFQPHEAGRDFPPLGVAWYFGFVDRSTVQRQLCDSSRLPLLQKLTPLLAQANLIERVKRVGKVL